jgi:hypothetical protein
MDYFESIVKTLLEQKGYWVRQSFKVNLTKKEKRDIGKHSIPRPEIDLLAYNPDRNEVLVIEAKSFLDSTGVNPDHLKLKFEVPEGRYKLFTCKKYRDIVFNRLKTDLLECGLATKPVTLKLGLAAAKVYQSRSPEIEQYFSTQNWYYFSPENIKAGVNSFSDMPYENELAIITAKILLR